MKKTKNSNGEIFGFRLDYNNRYFAYSPKSTTPCFRLEQLDWFFMSSIFALRRLSQYRFFSFFFFLEIPNFFLDFSFEFSSHQDAFFS